MSLASAAAIGAVSGLRSMTGPAVIAEAASRNRIRLKKSPFAWLSSDGAARTSALLAVGELIADKLPFVPNRTDPPSLVIRAVSGALCGAALNSHCGSYRDNRKQVVLGALIGGVAAVAASYIGLKYRKAVNLPKLPAALLEDAVTIGLGAAIITCATE